ncbi:MAG: hypothetical protein ABI158_11635, partial [Edaphobacter sp.]
QQQHRAIDGFDAFALLRVHICNQLRCHSYAPPSILRSPRRNDFFECLCIKSHFRESVDSSGPTIIFSIQRGTRRVQFA